MQALRIRRHSHTQTANAPWAIYSTLADALRPRPVLSLSQWADEHRILTSKGSGEPGRWHTDRTPYLREPMDSLSVSSPVQRVVVMSAAQIGKTEIGLNWIGYVAEHSPAPMLIVLPTLEVRKRWSRQRLDPMLEASPALSKLFSLNSRDGVNTEDYKDFPGGQFVLSGANSPASLGSMPIRFVLCDEVDRFPWDVGGEGDPIGLIAERQKNFPRRKLLMVSTPTIKGSSRIEREYENSDQRKYHVPCPHCGGYQVLMWKRKDGTYGIRHDEDGSVWYECEHCRGRIEEHHKPVMLKRGEWRADRPGHPTRGYWLNGLYAPIGLGYTWLEIWAQWEEAQQDTASLKRFINTTLAETWEEIGDTVDDSALMMRCEDYPEDLPVDYRTAGIDVQKDRLEMTVVDWGKDEEAWVQDHVILPGDTAQGDVWRELDETLNSYKVDVACVDSGYNTPHVHAFAERKRWVVPTKGIPGFSKPFIEDIAMRRRRLRKRNQAKHVYEPIGVDQGKVLVYSRLKVPEAGPRYIHFPRDSAFDEEYFAQLAAEKLVKTLTKGRQKLEWVAQRPRNEALDCMLLAFVARRLVDIIQKRAGRRGAGKAKEGDEAQQEDEAPPRRMNQPAVENTFVGSSEWNARL